YMFGLASLTEISVVILWHFLIGLCVQSYNISHLSPTTPRLTYQNLFHIIGIFHLISPFLA
ncbi:MAG: hypothetical protein K2I12_09925, partial [Duncaniella sp.]|nr:hypothetical protein [Duncaniella sp.]